MTDIRTLYLIDELRQLPAETGWVEFKSNLGDGSKIAMTISALANTARLNDQHCAYIVWGVEDGSHKVIGTDFDPGQKYKNDPLEFWIARRLRPALHLTFKTVAHRDGRVVLLEIPAATASPVEFEKSAYIRIGSATPSLSDYPELQKALWDKLRPYAWESGIAFAFATGDDVLSKLDYPAYFNLVGRPLPDSRLGILEQLCLERLIQRDVAGHWNITNLGALLFARSLDGFEPKLARKAMRFIMYAGNNRATEVVQRQTFDTGYANGFQPMMSRIHAAVPHNEHIGIAFRQEAGLYPAIALRELIANALIHQDMTITGAGPMIELFKDRVEITNPGNPLIKPERFIDSPPRSRNEALAALMRRMRICEEQGSGIDKVIHAVELFQLPPPDFQVQHDVEGGAMRVVLYAPRRFAQMTAEERVRACYQHAVLRYVSGDKMQNSTLRERFGIEKGNAAQVSKVIAQALEQGLIRPADPERPRAAYVPSWA